MTGRTLILLAFTALSFGAALVCHDAGFLPGAPHADEALLELRDDAGGTRLTADGSGGVDTTTPASTTLPTTGTVHDARTELAEADDAEEPAGRRRDARPILEVSGRVVDRAGIPVAGAELRLSVRSAYAVRPSSDAEDLRSALRSLAKTAATASASASASRKPERRGPPTLHSDKNGDFVFRARAYDRSHVAITAQHRSFAPTCVEDDWSEGDRIVAFGDLVLETGGTATGTVVDVDQDPIEGAVVRFVPVPESLLPPHPDAAAETAKTEAKEAQAHATPTVPRGTVDLIAPVVTGADGNFELKHLPPGPFVLLVDKARHLLAVTEPGLIASDTTFSAGKMVLELGAAITGQVLGPTGQPIAGVAIDTRSAQDHDTNAGRRFEGRPTPQERRPAKQEGRPAKQKKGAPPTRAQPDLRELAMQTVRRTVASDERGVFRIEGLPPQPLHLAFRHEGYIDEDRGPLDPRKASRLDVEMAPRLAIEGRLVSRVDGQPIETFGIVARRIPPARPVAAARNPRAANTAMSPKRAPKTRKPPRPAKRPASRFQESPKARTKRLAREHARQAALQKRELARQRKEQQKRDEQRALASILQQQAAYVRDRLGPTGQVPRSRPRPKRHEDGRFRLEGLQPGTYALDLVAPGHVKLAAGPFELTRGQRPLALTLHADRGVTLTGQVLDRKNGEPITGAQLELRLPPLDLASQTTSKTVRAKLRWVRTDMRVDRARTGRDGRFSMPGLRPGMFQLVVQAKSYRTLVDAAVAISGRPETRHTVRLERAASVRGTVTGRESGADYTVILVGTDGSRNARVDPKSGRYAITTLAPGPYYTLIRRADQQDSRREKAELAARRKRGFHDLRVYAHTQAVHDLDATDTALGALRGHVYHNGREAPGFAIQLVPESAASAAAAKRIAKSSQLRATADPKAAFSFPYLEPGSYTLEVTPSRDRSRRSRGAWHRERIVVREGHAGRLRIDIRTGDVRFRILDARTGAPVPSARIDMVAAGEAGRRAPREWRRLASNRRGTVRDGAGAIRDLLPGRYVYVVSGSGLASEPLHVTVPAGTLSLVVRVAPRVKKKASKKAKQGPAGARAKR